MQQKLVRQCPQCGGERPATEYYCEGEWNGAECRWGLSDQPLVTLIEASTETSEPEVEPASEMLQENDSDGSWHCPVGHTLEPGDLLCFSCNLDIVEPVATSGPATIVDGWRLMRQLPSNVNHVERFLVERVDRPSDGSRYVINIFQAGIQPDRAVYEALNNAPPSHLTALNSFGMSENRAYEVWEEPSDDTLEELLTTGAAESVNIREIARQLASGLEELNQIGVRHRDLRPCNILLLSEAPVDIRLGGFSLAFHSQFDLERICAAETNRYTAPEALVGAVSVASDWWSLGVILLDIATAGKCFEGVNEKAYQIHVVTRGIEVPSDVDPYVATLIEGLLIRDPNSRWKWDQVKRWLDNQMTPRDASKLAGVREESGAYISLGEKNFFTPEAFALSAAESHNWDLAYALLSRGAIATWLVERKTDSKIVSTIRTITSHTDLSDDLKLALAILALNPNMPLSIRGEIVNPAWLLSNAEAGYELVTGTAVRQLQQMEREGWLQALSERASTIRKRMESLELTEFDEPSLRIALLSMSRRNLERAWANKRRLFPESEHPGVLSLLERRVLTEEDLIILVSIEITYFVPAEEVVEKTLEHARRIDFTGVDPSLIKQMLAQARTLIYENLDQRIENFARCGINIIDGWADNYRLERRIELERALILLSVPKEQWIKPPKQQYVRQILNFFERRILASVLRGPLVKQSLSKNSASIDLMELGGGSKTAVAILDHFLNKSGQTIEIDPSVLDEDPQLDSRIRKLVQRTKTFRRDTGRHGLFLGFPFVVHRTSRLDETKTSLRVAPLLLWPVKVDSSLSSRSTVKLAYELEQEEARLNPALQAVLGLDVKQLEKWTQCAEELLRRSTLTRKDVLNAFGQIADVPDEELRRLPGKDTKLDAGKLFIASSGVLFNCDFAGKSIADDLRHIIERPLTGTALEHMIRVAEVQAPGAKTFSKQDTLDSHCVIDSDPSQIEAVLSARGETGLHIEGPPGTGKSQTIVNIIADSVAQGNTVLVVCDKQAALHVVEKRLTAEGLGNRLFLITDLTKDREPTIKKLRDQLETRNDQYSEIAEFKRDRSKLVARLRLLDTEISNQQELIFRINSKFGLSYRHVLSNLIDVETSGCFVNLAQLRQILGPLDDPSVTQIEYTCGALAKLWFDSKIENSPLHALKKFVVDDSSEKELNELFRDFYHAEQARIEVLKAHPMSGELGDARSLKEWLALNESYFRALPENQRGALSTWLFLFSSGRGMESTGAQIIKSLSHFSNALGKVNPQHHNDLLFPVLTSVPVTTLDNLLNLATKAVQHDASPAMTNARWEIIDFLRKSGIRDLADDGSSEEAKKAFARFLTAEEQRDDLLRSHPECFLTEEPLRLEEWLSKHVQFFSNIPDTVKANARAWISHFCPNKDSLSEGSRFLGELTDIKKGLLELKEIKHHQDLFDILTSLTFADFTQFLCQARLAGSTPTNDSNSSRLEAKWRIARLLKQSGIEAIAEDLSSEPIKTALSEFIAAEESREKSMASSTAAFSIDDGATMDDWKSKNESFFLGLTHDNRKHVASMLHLFEANGEGESKGPLYIEQMKRIIEELDQLRRIDSDNLEQPDEEQSRAPAKKNADRILFDLLREASAGELTGYLNGARLANSADSETGGENRLTARWQIAHYLKKSEIEVLKEDPASELLKATLTSFIYAEKKRGEIMARGEGRLLAADGIALKAWVYQNESFFRSLSMESRKNVSAWLHLFTDGTANEQKGERYIAQLRSLMDDVESLNETDHYEPLFDSLAELPEQSLISWTELARKATASGGIFTAFNPLRLLARWRVCDFLKKLNLPSHDSGLLKFLRAAELEVNLVRARAQFAAIVAPLKIPRHRIPQPIERFRQQMMDLLVALEEVRTVVARAVACPALVELTDALKAADAESTERFFRDAAFTLRLYEARNESLSNLNNLSGYFPPSWIAGYKDMVASSSYDIAFLVSRWEAVPFNNDATMRLVLHACELQTLLIPIRAKFNSLVQNLLKSASGSSLSPVELADALRLSSVDTLLPVEQFRQQVLDILKSLEESQLTVRRISSCPLRKEFVDVIKTANPETAVKFFTDARWAIKLHQARIKSDEAVDKLADFFPSEWLAKHREIIAKSQIDLGDWRLILDALPFQNETTINMFLQAAEVESSMIPLRDKFNFLSVRLGRTLFERRLTCAELLRELDDLLQPLIAVSDATERLYACPALDQAIASALHEGKDAFNLFVKEARTAIKLCNARAHSNSALRELDGWFTESWIAERRSNITRQISDLDSLRRIEDVLSLLNNAVMQTVLNAVQLELELAPVRAAYNANAHELKLPSSHPNTQNLGVVLSQINNTHNAMQQTAKDVALLDSCPLSEPARAVAATGNVSEFDKFLVLCTGSISRFEARVHSQTTLHKLSPYIEDNWLDEYSQRISSCSHNFSEVESITSSLPTLGAFQSFRARAEGLDEATKKIFAQLRTQADKLSAFVPDTLSVAVRQTIRREACLNWKAMMESEELSLTFCADEIETKVASVEEDMKELMKLNRVILAEPSYEGVAHDWENVTRLRGARARRLRELIEMGTELGLMKVRPVWLMNPEVASRLLPLKPGLFDKVIFDEASQLRVEHALPALYRAKQAIVSGDDKQMPPSEYFSTKIDTGEEDDDVEESDDLMTESQRVEVEENWNRKEIKDCPDLLTLASAVLPSRRLEIHYRSEYRELIEFSNAAFYSGSLNIPSKHPFSETRRVRPIEVITVNGEYVDQTNPSEAARIVQLLSSYWLKKGQRPTIGVVSFNKKQADLISKTISDEAQKNPRFAAALLEEENREEDGEDMGFFVKNLENVQGDERDIIIFSTTFGKDRNGRFRRNFGKLGQQGGERRLNVAITRAKKKILLLTSMPISEISTCISANRPPSTPRDYLHYYLDYATRLSDGRIEEAYASIERLYKNTSKTLSSKATDAFVSDVRAFIAGLGYETVQANERGAFNLDLAIVHPKTGLFGMGIECDAPRHPLLQSTYHREVWRRSVLQRSISVIHRISCRDWYQDRARQKKLLKELIEETIGASAGVNS